MRFDLGFLGGGQLARMSTQAAQRLGINTISLDPGDNTPASALASAVQGELHQAEDLAKLLSQVDHATLENEFIPANALRLACELAGFDPLRLTPGIDTLEIIQDKLVQRRACHSRGVPSPEAVAIEGEGEQAIQEIGFPMVLKARFGGYDGKGTRYAKTAEEFATHRNLWGQGGWLAESFVPFVREVAVMVFIDEQGAGAFPTMHTIQKSHVCDLVFPARADASKVAEEAVRAVNGKGLFGVELFELADGTFQVNEIAPRPHNSGHYTLDWGGPTQFEHHVRLAMRFPVETRPTGLDVCMVNLLGQSNSDQWKDGVAAVIAHDPAVRVHGYGKVESRKGRKMGHLNLVQIEGESLEALQSRALHAQAVFYGALV